METITIIWEYVIPFIFVLTVLVFVHELGHYAIARRNGVRVEVFSIGFGPELFGWNDSKDTRWKISAVPMGGYVKMFGQGDIEDTEDADGTEKKLSDDDKARSFSHKTLGQRTAVVFAGPAANFLFAVVIFAGLFNFTDNAVPLAGIGGVVEGSAAYEGGFKQGDRIVAVDGKKVNHFVELRDIVSVKPSVELTFDVIRLEKTIVLKATPKPHKDDSSRGMLGVRPDPKQVEIIETGVVESMWKGVTHSFVITGKILSGIGEMITGKRGSEDIGGPLRIAQLSGEVAQGGFVNLLNFIAVFSINLFLINLFPIPMLDGGHLVFYAIEAVRGKPLGERAQEYGFRVGLFLVLALMLFATINDLAHFKVFEFLINLVT
ncbi:MAG: RIP metalloprotease RseP [Rhodospirillales bacterium]|nr:RIP metalloprotease RseP [Rhodospirillales bacterium]